MATPLKIRDGSGNIQELTTSEENYIAYQIGLQLADAAVDSAGALNKNTLGNNIGSFTDTFFNEPVGTHPSTSITTGTTTTPIYQTTGTASEADSDWHRPLMWVDSGGETGFKEMPDTDLNEAIDRYLGTVFTNNYPGSFKLGSTSPGPDYSVHLSNAFTDTRTDGTSVQYNIYKRTSMTAPTAVAPLYVRDNGGFDGVQAMTDRQIKTTFGQRAKTRIMNSGIGTYELRSATQGAPTSPGTWVSAGAATDTKQTTSDVVYQTDSTIAFVAQYQRNYQSAYVTNFTSVSGINYTKTYSRAQFAANYSRAFTRVQAESFAVPYTQNYTSVYAKAYTKAYTGTYNKVYTGNYQNNYARNFTNYRNINYQRNYTGTYNKVYTGNYQNQYSTNFLAYKDINYTTAYQGTYAKAYTINYVKSYTNTYSRAFVTNYQRAYTGTYNKVYTGNYQNNYARNFLRYRDINYQRNYTGTYVRRYTGNYNKTYTTNFLRNTNINYARNYTGTYQRAFQGAYNRNYTANYARNFVGGYVRNVSSNYVGAVTNYYVNTAMDAAQAKITTLQLAYGREVFRPTYFTLLAGTAERSPLESVGIRYTGNSDMEYYVSIQGLGGPLDNYISGAAYQGQMINTPYGQITSHTGDWVLMQYVAPGPVTLMHTIVKQASVYEGAINAADFHLTGGEANPGYWPNVYINTAGDPRVTDAELMRDMRYGILAQALAPGSVTVMTTLYKTTARQLVGPELEWRRVALEGSGHPLSFVANVYTRTGNYIPPGVNAPTMAKISYYNDDGVGVPSGQPLIEPTYRFTPSYVLLYQEQRQAIVTSANAYARWINTGADPINNPAIEGYQGINRDMANYIGSPPGGVLWGSMPISQIEYTVTLPSGSFRRYLGPYPSAPANYPTWRGYQGPATVGFAPAKPNAPGGYPADRGDLNWLNDVGGFNFNRPPRLNLLYEPNAIYKVSGVSPTGSRTGNAPTPEANLVYAGGGLIRGPNATPGGAVTYTGNVFYRPNLYIYFSITRSFAYFATPTASQTGWYAPSYLGALSGTGFQRFAGGYLSDNVNYQVSVFYGGRPVTSNYESTGGFPGTNFGLNYTGNYTGAPVNPNTYFAFYLTSANYASQSPVTYNRVVQSTYNRDFTGTFQGGSYVRTFLGATVNVNYEGGSFVTNYQTNYQGNYTRNFAIDYVRNVDINYTGGSFATNYQTNYVGNYTGAFAINYSSTSNLNYTGAAFNTNYQNQYTGAFNTAYNTDYAKAYTTNYEGANFNAAYQTNYVGNYTGAFAINYSSTSNLNYTGASFATNYQTNYVGNYTGEFAINYSSTSNLNYTGAAFNTQYSTDYASAYITTYTNNYTGTYTSVYTGAYNKVYTTDYETTYVGTYLGNYENQYTTDYVTDYLTNYIGNYIGDFLGETIDNTSETNETYTLFVRIA